MHTSCEPLYARANNHHGKLGVAEVALVLLRILCVDEPKPSHDSCPALKVSVDAEMMQLERQTDEEFAGEQAERKTDGVASFLHLESAWFEQETFY